MDIPYEKLPERLRESMKHYIEEGAIPGDFLIAVICNNLVYALSSADDEMIEKIEEIVFWAYNHIPSRAFGSHKKMIQWNQERGLKGLE